DPVQPPRSASFLATSLFSKPTISKILCLLFSPAASDTADRDTFKHFAMNSNAALLAFPSTGGAFKRRIHSPSRSPENSVFFALGITRILSCICILAAERRKSVATGASPWENHSTTSSPIRGVRFLRPSWGCDLLRTWSRGGARGYILTPLRG